MTYNIETLSQSELFRLLIEIHDRYEVDAIDSTKMKEELCRIESLKRQKQIARDLANSGYSTEELLEVLTQMSGEKDKVKVPPQKDTFSMGKKEHLNDSSDIQLNIVGKIDLESINQRMRPEKEKKKTKSIRLNKVAQEYNIGLQNIVDFLAKKGQYINSNPNTKINELQYELIATAFSREQKRGR